MKKKWLQNVTTDSTSPPEGVFSKDAETIARVMAKLKVSPKGIGSAIRMVSILLIEREKGFQKRERTGKSKNKKQQMRQKSKKRR